MLLCYFLSSDILFKFAYMLYCSRHLVISTLCPFSSTSCYILLFFPLSRLISNYSSPIFLFLNLTLSDLFFISFIIQVWAYLQIATPGLCPDSTICSKLKEQVRLVEHKNYQYIQILIKKMYKKIEMSFFTIYLYGMTSYLVVG